MLENDKLCKKFKVYKKVIEDLKLDYIVVVASIEDNGVDSTGPIGICAYDVCTCKQHSYYLCFSNQMVH